MDRQKGMTGRTAAAWLLILAAVTVMAAGCGLKPGGAKPCGAEAPTADNGGIGDNSDVPRGRYVEQELRNFQGRGARFKYLFARLRNTAWAVVEQLSEVNKCRTIFATHYHELTKLNNRLKGLSLHCMKIKEFNGDVVFMHEVIPGAADRSYGIHVARLAGLPDLTVKRAEQVLGLLEEEKQNKALAAVEDDLPLFEVLKEKIEDTPKNPALEKLRSLDVDSLSPREALDKLYELKADAAKGNTQGGF